LNSPQVLAIVPARSGSQQLPGKNTMQVAGKPLLAWSVQHGLEANSITRVVCSTDSEEIAEIGRESGAEVPFLRPAEFATDLSNDAGFTRHAIEWYQDNEGWEPDIAIILRPTSPVRALSDIDGAVQMLHDNPEADSCLGVVSAEKTPFKMLIPTERGTVEPLITCSVFDQLNAPRQILPVALQQTGAIHLVRCETVTQLNTVIGTEILAYQQDGPVIDIDTVEDIKGVERVLLARLV
jgi:CMP-N,N'-diacetyllegionaminic acid synthase